MIALFPQPYIHECSTCYFFWQPPVSSDVKSQQQQQLVVMSSLEIMEMTRFFLNLITTEEEEVIIIKFFTIHSASLPFDFQCKQIMQTIHEFFIKFLSTPHRHRHKTQHREKGRERHCQDWFNIFLLIIMHKSPLFIKWKPQKLFYASFIKISHAAMKFFKLSTNRMKTLNIHRNFILTCV